MTHRAHPFLLTSTGRRFWPFNPDIKDIAIEDIAHALSHMCRFTGHTREFYSVAQHSVLVGSEFASLQPSPLPLYGLLHDASEAYLVDINRAIKADTAFDTYRSLEAWLQGLIYTRFGLHPDLPADVKVMDDRYGQAELRDLMVGADVIPSLANGIAHIEPWPPRIAKWRFLDCFERFAPMDVR